MNRGFLKLAVLTLFLFVTASRACTIFVLVDTNRTLFFNNEDWSNTTTRVWFIPAGEGYLGGVYVGFEEGWAQGGMNTAGLAYDWVAGVKEKWEPKPRMKQVRGNASQRMLETCSTVEQAIAFFETHFERGFATAEILVADKSGASAVIGVRKGELRVQRSTMTRGFGYGGETLQGLLSERPSAAVTNGVKILGSCMQRGRYATKYSNVFDLRNGDIFLYPLGNPADEVKLNLRNELQKGAHYFEMTRLPQQVSTGMRPLLLNMHRFPLDEAKPVEDSEPKVTARIRQTLMDACSGKVRREDYTEELWKTVKPEEIAAEMKVLGNFVALSPVGRENGSYLYLAEFTKARLVQRFTFDATGRIATSKTVVFEARP